MEANEIALLPVVNKKNSSLINLEEFYGKLKDLIKTEYNSKAAEQFVAVLFNFLRNNRLSVKEDLNFGEVIEFAQKVECLDWWYGHTELTEIDFISVGDGVIKINQKLLNFFILENFTGKLKNIVEKREEESCEKLLAVLGFYLRQNRLGFDAEIQYEDIAGFCTEFGFEDFWNAYMSLLGIGFLTVEKMTVRLSPKLVMLYMSEKFKGRLEFIVEEREEKYSEGFAALLFTYIKHNNLLFNTEIPYEDIADFSRNIGFEQYWEGCTSLKKIDFIAIDKAAIKLKPIFVEFCHIN